MRTSSSDSTTQRPHDGRSYPGEDDPALGIPGFHYSDLHRRDRLEDLLGVFEEELSRSSRELAHSYREFRQTLGANWPAPRRSDVLIALAPHVASFLARLFGIEREYQALIDRLDQDTPVIRFRRHLQKRALPRWTPDELSRLDPAEEARRVAVLLDAMETSNASDAVDTELSFARAILALVGLEEALSREGKDDADIAAMARGRERVCEIAARLPHDDPHRQARDPVALLDAARSWLACLERRAVWLHQFGVERREWVSLRTPEPVDHLELVRRIHPEADLPEMCMGPEETRRRRDGFRLTDPRMTPREIHAEVDYCILCHPREKDSCAQGLREKTGKAKENPLGIPLEGCPLQEKISEAHALRQKGESLAALALIIIDNPMCPGTGHRICNDCMKACIFQKQEPVNIPQAETGILMEVLSLPYGPEIYMLLTRWNPLNVKRPVPAPFHGKTTLVVGLGPAGYTLAHYLLNEGFGVVAIDGLKIEPLPDGLTGGPGRPPRPIRDFRELETNLDERILSGFGGVSEYGITVRWDKNFLTLIYLTLARREQFRFYGGVRFGGTLTLDDCWELGFDHVAIAAGAGKPTLVEMLGGLSRGIRQASDFLMALQLTGAFKRESLANLQIRLPAVVIGGGLTAIDAATELLAYYPIQVEKILHRFERLEADDHAGHLLQQFDEEERGILDEFLDHGRAVRAERERAEKAGEEPNLVGLVQGWGGVTISYRRTLQESPAYRLNHEEVVKCLEEGVRFAERLSPLEAIRDRFGSVSEIVFARLSIKDGQLRPSGDTVRLPARSVCVAAGTSPNVIYEREHPGTFVLDERGRYFQSHVMESEASGGWSLRPAARGEVGFFTSYCQDGRTVTYYGDNHPIYAGSVVKAMASARNGYAKIIELFAGEIARSDPAREPERKELFRALTGRLDRDLLARVERVVRLTPSIVEVVVRAPLAAQKFRPGQFFRLQNFESDSPRVPGTTLALEGIALTGAWVDTATGLLSLIVLEMGASSRLCALMKPGQRIIVMGPTGSPTEIPRGENVLLAGGGLGNAVLFSIAKAMRDAGNRVVYFAGYKNGRDLFKREDVEESSDQVIWSTDSGEGIEPRRPLDRHFRGNIVQAILAYAKGDLGEILVPLSQVNRILAIGSDKMMGAVKLSRRTVLAPFLGEHVAIGSINSSMQCMLKEVCAQCLQQHVDPKTGVPTRAVFTCFCQDQILDEVDFGNLSDRLRMNSVQEKLTNLWLDWIFERHPLEKV